MSVASESYQNPFERETSKQLPKDEIVIEVEERKESGIKRKWKIDHEPSVTSNIKEARDKYVQYLKRVNGTANKEVWQVYEHLASDLFNDVMSELMTTIDKDLDVYCEKVIYDEFQLWVD